MHPSTNLRPVIQIFIGIALFFTAPAAILAAEATPAPRVATAPGIVVNVLGAVRNPGAYPLPAGATLLDALAAAGGGTSTARLGKISILRGAAGEKSAVSQHDSNAILRGEAVNPQLLTRDTIFVSERVL